MDDIFSKIISIILISILMCVIPAFYISIYTDFNEYLQVNNQIECLLDQITLNGYVKENEFFNDNNLEIIVERDLYMPFSNEIVSYAFSKYTILKNIEDKEIQKFEIGDVITVIYKNKAESANVFLNKIFGLNIKEKNIVYSSIVKNECF